MICDLNKFDPLPALGAKVKPLNTAPLTAEQKKQERESAFERSRLYDVALHIETAIRDDINRYGFTAYWF
jgi:hypothetical protein